MRLAGGMKPKTTKRVPSPTDLGLVDGLLTFLGQRAAGALDLGMVMLLEPPPERYDRYVSEHIAAPMRAAALVLRLSVAGVVPAPSLTPFDAISVDTEKFLGALGDLRGYATQSADQLNAVVDRLGKSFHRLRDSFLDVGERLGFEPTLSTDAAPERDAFYEQILDRLYSDLLAERGPG